MKIRLVFAILAVCASIAEAQTDRSRLMGVVTDASGGALPGATITVSGAAQSPSSVVTDESGRYLTPWVVPGTYNVTFEMPGFDTHRVTNVRLGAGQTIVLDQQLSLATLSETVEVRAPVPPPPRAPRTITPRPQAKPVEKEALASVCGPRVPPDFSVALGRVLSERDSNRQLLGPGDLLRLDVGAKHGVAKEQNFVVRRRFLGDDEYGTKKAPLLGEQTAGLVQIIEVDDKSSVAIVVYACGEILAGDTVEPFIPSPAFFAIADGKPRFDEPARITFGEYDSTIAGAGQMMVIDRGTLRGVQRGQRVTLFRASAIDKQLPVTIGDGVVIAVRADSATIRIERTTDAVWVGDLVALHR